MKRISLVHLALAPAEVEEALAAIRPILERGWFLLGKETDALESLLAEQAGVAAAVAVGNGTDALTIGMQGLGFGPGDEVIVPSFTAFPTAVAVLRAGATPVLADVCAELPLLDLNAALALVTPRTRAVVLVHLYGIAADVHSFRAAFDPLNIAVIEDCAQAQGAVLPSGEPVGSVGSFGALSFYPTKNLGGIGDGGALLTDESSLIAEARGWRSHGEMGERYRHERPAGNSRIDEVGAAVLRLRLAVFEGVRTRRREISARYAEAFSGVVPYAAHGDGGSPHLAVIRVDDPTAFAAELDRAGIDTGRHYPRALVDQPSLAHVPCDDAVQSRAWARSCLSLPLHPELTDEDVDRVIVAVEGAATVLRQ